MYFFILFKPINAYCGNGIREVDEECDCGSPEVRVNLATVVKN